MENYSDDFLAGWAAARAEYQSKNSVSPYPPGYSVAAPVEGDESPPTPEPVSDSEE